MKAIVVALALLLFVSISSWPAAAVPPLQYDAMLLAEQWPPSFCHNPGSNCDESGFTRLRFNIHGLWPMKSNGRPADSDPQYDGARCQGLHYNRNQLPEDLQNNLGSTWTNYRFGEKNSKLWGDEWEKHGRCSNLTQQVYFERAVNLFRAHDSLQIIGLTPGVYPEPIDTIRRRLGIEAVLKCKQDKKGRWMLEEIGRCVNRDATTFIGCPPYIKDSGCGNATKLYIPKDGSARLFSTTRSTVPR